jgi:hypothetical protein
MENKTPISNMLVKVMKKRMKNGVVPKHIHLINCPPLPTSCVKQLNLLGINLVETDQFVGSEL